MMMTSVDTQMAHPTINVNPCVMRTSATTCNVMRSPATVGVGFEPTVTQKGHAGFQDRCIQPLCHPTGGDSGCHRYPYSIAYSCQILYLSSREQFPRHVLLYRTHCTAEHFKLLYPHGVVSMFDGST